MSITKKNILFVINNLNVGGVEKSLLALLNALPPERYNITVGVISLRGDLQKSFPPHIRVVEIPVLSKNIDKISGKFSAIIKCLRAGNLKDAFLIPMLYLKSKIAKTLIPLYSHYVTPESDDMPAFDVAVAYQGPNELIDYYISHIIRAEKKIGWIHFDIEKSFIRKATVERCYKQFDKIMLVSNDARRHFNRMFPRFADRTEVMLNIINAEDCLRLAQQTDGLPYKENLMNICTVGRLSSQKAQDISLQVAAILKEEGLDFHWYFIGNGPRFDEYSRMARQMCLDNYVSFLGNQLNPYKFMAHCDVYVQNSRYEGYCIAIGEAKLFGVPIVATDFVGAREQLADVPNAIIVDELTPKKIADTILRANAMGKINAEYSGNPPQVQRLLTLFG